MGSWDNLIQYGKKSSLCIDKPVDIIINFLTVHYSIHVDRRVSIISDDSCTGKSLLYDLVRNKALYKSDVSDNVAAIDLVSDIVHFNDKKVFIIDETCACLHGESDSFNKVIASDTDHFYILVSREKDLTWLPFSPDDIFVFYTKNGLTSMKHKYADPLYLDKDCTSSIKICYVEDRGSDFSFMNNIIKDEINVESLDGKNNWYEIKKSHNCLLIIDRCGAGSIYGDIYEYVTYIDKSVIVLDYECFEYMLLDILGLDIPNVSFVYNKEDVYFNELKKYLTRYTKSENCSCVSGSCYTKCSDGTIDKCKYNVSVVRIFGLFKRSIYGRFLSSIMKEA